MLTNSTLAIIAIIVIMNIIIFTSLVLNYSQIPITWSPIKQPALISLRVAANSCRFNCFCTFLPQTKPKKKNRARNIKEKNIQIFRNTLHVGEKIKPTIFCIFNSHSMS